MLKRNKLHITRNNLQLIIHFLPSFFLPSLLSFLFFSFFLAFKNYFAKSHERFIQTCLIAFFFLPSFSISLFPSSHLFSYPTSPSFLLTFIFSSSSFFSFLLLLLILLEWRTAFGGKTSGTGLLAAAPCWKEEGWEWAW